MSHPITAAEFRQILETRIERPIEQINNRLAHIEETLKEHDGRFNEFLGLLAKIDRHLEKQAANPLSTGRPE